MNFIFKNMQKLKPVIAVLGVAAIVLLLIGFFRAEIGFTDKLSNIFLTVGFLAGIAYALSDFGKAGARYYSAFMIIYTAVSLYNAFSFIYFARTTAQLYSLSQQYVNTAAMFLFPIAAVLVGLLAFVKNLGKKISVSLARINLVIVGVIQITEIIMFKDFARYMGIYAGSILLAAVTLLFVAAKYADKELRNAE